MKFPNIDPSYRTRVVVACYERKLVRGYVAESTFAGKRLRECVCVRSPQARVLCTREHDQEGEHRNSLVHRH